MSDDTNSMSGTDRAALLLLSLGEAEASQVLKHLDAKDVQQVGTAMAGLKEVSKENASAVLDGFITDFENQAGFGSASREYIRRLLTSAFSAQRADALMSRMSSGDDASGIDALKWMDCREILEIVDGEHPQIVAIVVSFLEPEIAAQVVTELDDERRPDVIMRIANLSDVQQTALAEIEALIAHKSEESSSSVPRAVGGAKVAAAIVNSLGSTSGDEVLEQIKSIDAPLGDKIQDMMFIFESLLAIDDRGIQALLREISNDLLVVALKGADPEMQDKILNNMSKRAAALLKDDMEARGPTKLSDVETAQREILEVAKRLADAGEIDLGGGGDEYV